MGIGGISIWQLLIIFLIVVMLFGTRRLSSLGTDLGSALKGFKKALNPEDSNESADPTKPPLTSASRPSTKEKSHV